MCGSQHFADEPEAILTELDRVKSHRKGHPNTRRNGMTNLLPNSARPGSAKTFAGVLTVAATMLIVAPVAEIQFFPQVLQQQPKTRRNTPRKKSRNQKKPKRQQAYARWSGRENARCRSEKVINPRIEQPPPFRTVLLQRVIKSSRRFRTKKPPYWLPHPNCSNRSAVTSLLAITPRNSSRHFWIAVHWVGCS